MIAVPSLESHIRSALEHDNTILDKHVEHQFQVLVINPLRTLPESNSPLVIVIDGLDECKDAAQASDLLALFSLPGSDLQFPLHIFITSRPKAHICAAFDHLRTDLQVSSSNLERPNTWPKFKMIFQLLPPHVSKLTGLSLCISITLPLLILRIPTRIPFHTVRTYQFHTIPPVCVLSIVYHGIIFSSEYHRRWWGIRSLSTSSEIVGLALIAVLNLVWVAPLALISIDLVEAVHDRTEFYQFAHRHGILPPRVKIEWIPPTLVAQLVLCIIEVVTLLFIAALSVLGRKLGRNHEYRAIQAYRWRSMNTFP